MKPRRRTKGPSEKIRSLAAISLANKIAYLNVSDLTGGDLGRFEEKLNKRLVKRVFDEGDRIFPNDRLQNYLLLLKTGSVNIYRQPAGGERLFIKTIHPGTIFGEMQPFGQMMLGAEAEAASRTEILLISTNDMEQAATNAPSIGLNLARQIGPRLVEAERRHEQAAFQPVTARLASLLMRLSNGSNQVLGYTHQQLADALGVYRETVTNAIGELKDDKLIDVGRKRITLKNVDALGKLHSI